MNRILKASIGVKLLTYRLFGIRRPVMASWSVTNRCNMACRYCHWPGQPEDELNTDQARAFINEIAGAGVKVLVFTGGEPLAREDMPKLLGSAKKAGLSTGLNTNGFLIPSMYDICKDVDFFQLSLDGPAEINDDLRGDGAFKAALDALDILKSDNRKVKLNATITRKLIGNTIGFMELIRELETPIMFHPVSHVHAGELDINNLIPDQDELSGIIEELIQAKKAGIPILNSIPGLNKLQGAPDAKPLKCYWWLSVNLTPAGEMVVCNQLRHGCSFAPATKGRLLSAIDNLPDPYCERCWCANPTELNLLLNFDFETIRNSITAKF